jgi:hypothetical protein
MTEITSLQDPGDHSDQDPQNTDQILENSEDDRHFHLIAVQVLSTGSQRAVLIGAAGSH